MNANANDARRYRELARLARNDARRSINPETKALLHDRADGYDRAAEALERSSDH